MTDEFHRTRMRAVGFSNIALLTAGVDLGDNNSRQLQQSSVDDAIHKEQDVVNWLHKLADSSFHPLGRHSKMHVFAMMPPRMITAPSRLRQIKQTPTWQHRRKASMRSATKLGSAL